LLLIYFDIICINGLIVCMLIGLICTDLHWWLEATGFLSWIILTIKYIHARARASVRKCVHENM
jgi:hypothetical protein